MMTDIDAFKQISDTYGHPEGDKALTLTTSALKQACRSFPKRPYIARYGGDEFIIIMDGGLKEAETLRNSINDRLANVRVGFDNALLSISTGISLYETGFDSKSWIADADTKLYEVKQTKRIGRSV